MLGLPSETKKEKKNGDWTFLFVNQLLPSKNSFFVIKKKRKK